MHWFARAWSGKWSWVTSRVAATRLSCHLQYRSSADFNWAFALDGFRVQSQSRCEADLRWFTSQWFMSSREKTANCDPGKSWQNGNCSGSKCSFGRLFQDHLCREHKVARAREERAKQSSEDLLKIGLIGSRFAKSYFSLPWCRARRRGNNLKVRRDCCLVRQFGWREPYSTTAMEGTWALRTAAWYQKYYYMITYDYYDIWNVPGCAVSHLLVSPCASSFESVSNEVSIETYWDHTGLLSTAFLVAATASCHISHTKRRIKSIQIV